MRASPSRRSDTSTSTDAVDRFSWRDVLVPWRRRARRRRNHSENAEKDVEMMLDPDVTGRRGWGIVEDAPDLTGRGRAIFEHLRDLAAADAGQAAAHRADVPGDGAQGESATEATTLGDAAVPRGTDARPPPAADEDSSALAEPASSPAVSDGAAVDERSRPSPDGPTAPTSRAPIEYPEPDSFVRPLPRVMAIANQKGGVGKTTTAVNLGAGLAELGYRTLVIDLDPQGNATTGLGINPRNLTASVYDVLMRDIPIEDAIEPSAVRNLFVVPATIDLAGAEIELVPAFSRELKLRRSIEGVGEDFDFVLVDCPPSLGLITVNGLAAASEVVVPIQCEYYALEGLGQLLRNINLVKGNLNPRLELSAIILTMYDARTKLAEQVANEVRTHFGGKVCRNVVPRSVRLSEAPSFGQPIIVFDPSSRGALAYRELAKEVSGGAPQRVR
jgi:chromosome partitioning protein